MPIPGGDLQPLDRPICIRLSPPPAAGEALALGIPLAEDRIRKLVEDGYRPAGDAGRVRASGPRRGPLSDGARPDRWGPRAGDPASAAAGP